MRAASFHAKIQPRSITSPESWQIWVAQQWCFCYLWSLQRRSNYVTDHRGIPIICHDTHQNQYQSRHHQHAISTTRFRRCTFPDSFMLALKFGSDVIIGIVVFIMTRLEWVLLGIFRVSFRRHFNLTPMSNVSNITQLNKCERFSNPMNFTGTILLNHSSNKTIVLITNQNKSENVRTPDTGNTQYVQPKVAQV